MWWIRRSMMATGRWLPPRRAKPKRWSGATLLPETWPMQRGEPEAGAGGGCAVDQQHGAAVRRRDGGDGRRAEQQGNGRQDHGCRQGAAQKPDWYFIQSRYVGR